MDLLYWGFDSWGIIINSLNQRKKQFVDIGDYLNQNQEKADKLLDKKPLHLISEIFCEAAFSPRSRNLNHDIEEDIYSAKLSLFEFLCYYLLDRSEKDPIWKGKFVLIMQQALPYNFKADNEREKKYLEIIINVMTEYLVRNNKIDPGLILSLIRKQENFVNKESFLGVYDMSDPEKRLIPPKDVQRQIADYVCPDSSSRILYLTDILYRITSFGIDNINTDFREESLYKKKYLPGINLSEAQKEMSYCINNSEVYFQLTTRDEDIIVLPRNVTPYIKDVYKLGYVYEGYIIPESTKLMKKVVNIAKKRALKLLESQLEQKNTPFKEKEKDLAIDTSEISNSNTSFTPKMTKPVSNIGSIGGGCTIS